jgi:hypothetical protein
MISQSANRIENQTCPEVIEKIRRQTEMRVAFYAEHPEEIDDRLAALDSEWDVERALETMAASVSLLGLTLAITRAKKFIVVPIVVQGFLLNFALRGWAPPIIVLRGFGFRTRGEIDTERYALKALRGDFQDLPKTSEGRGTAPVLEAVRK